MLLPWDVPDMLAMPWKSATATVMLLLATAVPAVRHWHVRMSQSPVSGFTSLHATVVNHKRPEQLHSRADKKFASITMNSSSAGRALGYTQRNFSLINPAAVPIDGMLLRIPIPGVDWTKA